MSTFDTDWTAVNGMFAEAFGVTGGVTIRRGGLKTTSVTAEAYVNEYRVEADEFALSTEISDRDYVIAVADFAFNGNAVEPCRGDVIEETINGAVVRFQVLPPQPDVPVAQWTDADANRWLIHTKRIN